jgi:hypothetical protein
VTGWKKCIVVDDEDADKGFCSIKMEDGQQCMRVLLGDLLRQTKVLGIVIATNEMARVDTTNGVGVRSPWWWYALTTIVAIVKAKYSSKAVDANDDND